MVPNWPTLTSVESLAPAVKLINCIMTALPIVTLDASELIWDGGYLTTYNFLEKNGLIKIKTRVGYYFNFNWCGQQIYCYAYNAENCYPCILDECKPYFGLPKKGTRWISRGRQVMILNRVTTSQTSEGGIEISTFPTLIEFEKNYCKQGNNVDYYKSILADLNQMIQQTYAFGIIFNVGNMNKSTLLVNWVSSDKINELIADPKFRPAKKISPLDKDSTGPIYYITTSREISSNCTEFENIADSVINVWFKESTPGEVIANMCRVRRHNSILRYCYITRTHIESIVMRIDRNMISLVDQVLIRLITLLDSSLGYKSSST